MSTNLPQGKLGQVEIGELRLQFLAEDGGGTHYYGRTHFEEYLSAFYPILRQTIDPRTCIDVGANYGYTGMLMRRAFAKAKLVLVEPIPWLEPFIRHNFERNGLSFDALHSAIVSMPAPGGRSQFGVNLRSSQDSRVIAQPGWETVETGVVTLDALMDGADPEAGVYIKVDTQGWERSVFASGETSLHRCKRWLAKSEFAPAWMESQGSDPAEFLEYLLAHYQVHEQAGRERWNAVSLKDLLGAPLMQGDGRAFTDYVRRLGRNDTGWVDLLILPRGLAALL